MIVEFDAHTHIPDRFNMMALLRENNAREILAQNLRFAGVFNDIPRTAFDHTDNSPMCRLSSDEIFEVYRAGCAGRIQASSHNRQV